MARRAMSLLPQWSSRIFSVELDGAPLYFSIQEQHRGEEVPRVFREVRSHGRCYSLLVCGGDRIRRAKFYGELKDKLLRDLPPGCDLSPMSSFLPNVKDSLIKGYFLKDNSKSSVPSERLLRDLIQHDPVLVCSYLRGKDDQLWTQRLWSHADSQTVETSEEYYVVPSEAPQYHPSTLNIMNSDVFYSFDEAFDVLKKCGDIIPEATSVLELLPSRAEARSKPDFPVIVIEGLDATGKTTLTESLKDTLGAALLRSPPQCLSPWRACFDQEPPLIRRAFYALGNYITAEQIGQEGMKTPVIVDRFWHSTAAYAIATAVSGPVCNLPAEGSEVYRWPTDLLQPSLVVLLTLDPEERKRRLRDRGQGKTEEEQKLDHNHLFRLRVEEAYRRIIGPACVTVDAGPSADQVLQQVQLLIRGKCHL
ncbi:LOW QUALITY PROTEIN: UMP-CMP kinase 2, mitochondrial [Micropterus salmoides]|uniref:LOW QUALITY PROTEIN: UMP-CMP kinase 2, mitochondrial n=1 Tax=Micropterus salmoides TaxID=27706 RepID=UPI0018EC76FB|nr:LOW QUALITY PROTEIN: UMP-CMP kinase 2, mitochondrial [Micropterus salmoides]